MPYRLALGVGRRMLDDLRELTKRKIGRAAQNAANADFLQGYGLAEAKLRAARAFVFETWTDAEETLGRGEYLSKRQETSTASRSTTRPGRRTTSAILSTRLRAPARCAKARSSAIFATCALDAARHLVAGRPAGLRSGAGGARRG